MSSANRSRGLVVRVAAVAAGLVLVSAGATGVATGKPAMPKAPPVSVVTLAGQPVVVATPGEFYDITFDPASAVSFTQMPGTVVSVSMSATITSGDATMLFCDVHAAVGMMGADSADTPIAMHQTVIMAQRGGDWWYMAEASGDLTRTIPAPAAMTTHTMVGKVWMDPPSEPEADCYGIADGGQYQAYTVPVRVSIVTLAGS